MRISDWSSDVCSSDLLVPPRHFDQNVFGIRCDHSQVQPPVKRRDQQCAVKIFECHAIVSGSAWLSRNSRIALLKTSLSSPTTMCPAPETSVNCAPGTVATNRFAASREIRALDPPRTRWTGSARAHAAADRKSVGWGKGVDVRGDHGGRRSMK